MSEPPEDNECVAWIESYPEMINVVLGTISDGGSWPVEFRPEYLGDVDATSIEHADWSWTEPQIPGHAKIFVPFELVEENEKLEFGTYDSWIAVNQLKIGTETYIPSEKLKPCPHPPEYIDTVVVSKGGGVGLLSTSLNLEKGEEVHFCKQCKTPLVI